MVTARFADQFVTFHQPSPGRQPTNVGHVDQLPAGQYIEPAEQFHHAGQQGPAHFLVMSGGALSHRPMAEILVAILDQPIEQLLRPNRAAAAALALERRTQ